MKQNIDNLLAEQLSSWETARNNYTALCRVQTKELNVNGIPYKAQFNPARIVSSAAKVDAKSIKERKCFLCTENLPAAQKSIQFEEHYNVLINPFPIFPRHLTITEKKHVGQRIATRFADMLNMAQAFSGYTIFYNGPQCGASAPDHAHFQAGNRGFMPIEQNWRKLVAGKVMGYEQATLWHLNDAPRRTLVIESPNCEQAVRLFNTIHHALNVHHAMEEPMMNILAWYEEMRWIVCIFPRKKHRPACYTATGEANLLCSPASVDLGGVFITPVEKDFQKIKAKDIAQILSEVCLSATEFEDLKQRIKELSSLYPSVIDGKSGEEKRDKILVPKVEVGIMQEPQIEFILPSAHLVNGTRVSGRQIVAYHDSSILWNGLHYDELLFSPINEVTDEFELPGVTIGINFHWERKEDQRFIGALKIIAKDKGLTAINVINVEDYLMSVISSEMSATASLELLKAHAVISRSWLLANVLTRKQRKINEESTKAKGAMKEGLLWYDREDHMNFDVCADDHCQRYQGITRASTEIVRQAIAATRGEVLMYDEKICDARFSKCCGGALEEFQYCWEDVKHPYLNKRRDLPCPSAASLLGKNNEDTLLSNLTMEEEASRWIRTSPKANCNTNNKKILSQVLNNYDQETTNFYRWRVVYRQDELSALILKRSGVDYGQIIDLMPMARGTSSRIWKLKIVGSKKTGIIGKELEIRRILSSSHLYSSAFVVDKEEIEEGVPGRFVLTGAGWGHGVGLCQIGAAVMGEQGYKYDAILLHYYVGARIDKLY